MRIAVIGAEFEENLAVRYLIAALETKGHEVISIVFNGPGDIDRAAGELASSGVQLAGLSMVFTYRAREFADLATRARRLAFAGHMTAGGHFAAFNAEALLRDVPAIDSVAVGEGEAIVCDLAKHLDDLASVRGLVWRSPQGVIRNVSASKPYDLDGLAIPPRKHPFDEYLGIPITNILASRGCAHACSFCSISAWHQLCGGERVRLRSPESIADEMAMLYRRGARIFNFHDDSFVLRDPQAFRARMAELSTALDRRGVSRIAFAIKSRPDAVSLESFAPLKSMGLFRVFLGIEAGTDTSLRQLGRRQTLADNVRALDVMQRLDLHAAYNLLLLNPDSTLEDLEGNVAFLRAHPHLPTNFCRTEVYAGTPLEHKLRKEGRLCGDYWGWSYAISEPRAQCAFELIAIAFNHRNHAVDGLHHLTMQVDYEHQLLGHFFETSQALRQQVKRFIVDVNHNTCTHLTSIIDTVRHAPLAGATRERLAREFADRIRRDDQVLRKVAEAIVLEIQARVKAASPIVGERNLWKRTAAAAGIAATMTLAACKETPTATHATEMAPLPASIAQSAAPPEDAAPTKGSTVPGDAGFPASSAAVPVNSNTAAPQAPNGPPKVRPPRVPSQHTEYAPKPPSHYNEMAPIWDKDNKN
jgi:anaerobic magnesium-protoporphyrin IX monomethyl ester cyclase